MSLPRTDTATCTGHTPSRICKKQFKEVSEFKLDELLYEPSKKPSQVSWKRWKRPPQKHLETNLPTSVNNSVLVNFAFGSITHCQLKKSQKKASKKMKRSTRAASDTKNLSCNQGVIRKSTSFQVASNQHKHTTLTNWEPLKKQSSKELVCTVASTIIVEGNLFRKN